MAKEKAAIFGILRHIFLAASYDDPVVRYRLWYFALAIAAFILTFWASFLKYLGWAFLLLFLVSVPLHFYERARMFRVLKKVSGPGQ